jgi:hypothetical protein
MLMRFRTLAAIVALIGGLLGVGAAPSVAETTSFACSNVAWGGWLYCGSPYDVAGMSPAFTFQNGVIQSWGVAYSPNNPADHNVYTRWLNPDNTVSPWRSLGGKIYSKVIWHSTSDHRLVWIGGIGGDGNLWCRLRNADGSWDAWFTGVPCNSVFGI